MLRPVEVRRAGGEQAEPPGRVVQEARLRLRVGGVEALDAVEPRGGEALERGERGVGVVDVPERMRPDGDAAGGVDDLDGLRDRRPRARHVGDGARHEVGGEELRLARDPLLAQPVGVGRVLQHRLGEVRAAERGARPLARLEAGAVEHEAELLEPVGHRVDAAPAVGAEVGERVAQRRVVVAQLVAEHVQVLEVALDRRQLGGGRAAHARGPLPRAAPPRRRRRCRGRSAPSGACPARRPAPTTSAAGRTPSECTECDCRSKSGRTCGAAMRREAYG